MGSRSVAAPAEETSAGFTMADLLKKPVRLPSRFVLYGPEGCGKTSFAAQFPDPVFVQSRGETGLEALIECGLVPEVQRFPEALDFQTLLQTVKMLANVQHEFKTCVIDTINGAERLCHEFVCDLHFAGNWSKEKGGFNSFGNGISTAMTEWRQLLAALDDLRAQKNMAIVLLAHTSVKNYKNPLGPDYDRFRGALADATWEFTKQWSDATLFLNYEDFVDVEKGSQFARGKATSAGRRFICTERTPAWDAKNRFNLPPQIECGKSAAEAFENFKKAMQAGRKQPSS